MSNEKKLKKPSPKTIKYIVGGCIAAALVAYIVITAIPEKQPAESNPVTASSIKLPPELFPDDQNDDSTAQTGDNQGSSSTSQDGTSDPNLIFKQDKVILTAGLNADDKPILACYVDRPVGYLMDSAGSSVTLWPEEMKLDATDEEPLILTWLNVLFFEKIIANGQYDDSKTGLYTLIDSYEYVPSDGKTAKVHIIQYEPSNNSMPYLMISADVEYESCRPSIRILEKNLDKFLSARYPDIQSLARAIFIPA